MRTPLISTVLLILVYIFNYMSSSGQLGVDQANLAQVFPFPYMPPGWTFMIAWGAIYLSLLGYLLFIRSKAGKTSVANQAITPRFWVSCILNILWITASSMEWYVISIAIIIGLFLVLGTMIQILSNHTLSAKEKRLMKIPFGLYYGWVSLATCIIAISQFVYQWNVELPLGQTWTLIVVGTGLLVAVYSWLRWRNIGQLLISLLAFAGIASVLL